MNLPEKFLEQMKLILKDNFDKFIEQYDLPPTKGLRINTLKCDSSIINKMGLTLDKIPYEEAYYLENNIKLGNHPFHLAGLFYLQEPSAMIPVASVDIPDDSVILDLCSAPGGKSSQIATKIPNGILLSNEVVPDRARILKENITRLGIKNCIITSNQPKTLAKELPNVFDFVFVDAPCSGEGMFRKEEIAIKEWYPELKITNATRQIDILNNAKQCVKDGGYLIYSTCTFNKEENEDLIREFLKQNENFTLFPVKDIVRAYTMDGIDLPEARRFYPFVAKGEGQFVAVLRKNGTTTHLVSYLKPNLNQKEEKIVRDFIVSNTDIKDFYLYKFNNEIYITEKRLIDTKRLNVYHYGVCVGTLEKNRVIPDHNFFVAYGDHFKNKINYPLESIEIKKFLHGEEIEIDQNTNGYGVIQCCGYTIGGGKIVNGRLKNYFPKRLRL